MDGIDGLRAVAALAVVAYHYLQAAGSPALRVGGVDLLSPVTHGSDGVDLFMAISGFCLFLPVVRGVPFASSRFYLSRLRRIVVPYYLSIGVALLAPVLGAGLAAAIGHHSDGGTWPSWTQWLTHLTFTQTFSSQTWGGIQGVYWTLGVEAEFYVVFPLVIAAYRRWGMSVVPLMIAASTLYRIGSAVVVPARHTGFEVTPFLADVFFLGRWQEFAAGMLAAYVVAGGRWRPTRLQALGLLAVAVGLFEITWQVQLPRTAGPRELLLSAASILLLVVAGTRDPHRPDVRRWMEARWLVFVGLISFSLYLIHQELGFRASLLLKLAGLRDGLPLLGGMLVVAVLMVGAALLFFELVEVRLTAAVWRRSRPRRLDPAIPLPSEPVAFAAVHEPPLGHADGGASGPS